MTSHIGLVATASTTYNEPYHVARKFASLDHISGGRAGWNVVTSWSDAEARNFNREKHLDYDTRYERAAEFVEVVTRPVGQLGRRRLPPRQGERASLLRPEPSMHVLNHQREALLGARPAQRRRATPQGRPIIVQAGASEQGQEIAAAHADVVYAASQDAGGRAGLLQLGQGAHGEIRPRAGRAEDHARAAP